MIIKICLEFVYIYKNLILLRGNKIKSLIIKYVYSDSKTVKEASAGLGRPKD